MGTQHTCHDSKAQAGDSGLDSRMGDDGSGSVGSSGSANTIPLQNRGGGEQVRTLDTDNHETWNVCIKYQQGIKIQGTAKYQTMSMFGACSLNLWDVDQRLLAISEVLKDSKLTLLIQFEGSIRTPSQCKLLFSRRASKLSQPLRVTDQNIIRY